MTTAAARPRLLRDLRRCRVDHGELASLPGYRGRVEYADLIERTFYNVVATSPRSDGRAFFYANPLQQRVPGGVDAGDMVSLRAECLSRAAWFDVSCCPTDLARTLATWQSYAAAAGDRDVVLLQFASGLVTAELGDGRSIGVEVETAYPHDGLVTVRVVDPPSGTVALHLRVPLWAHGAMLEDRGGRHPSHPDSLSWTASSRLVRRSGYTSRSSRASPGRTDAVRGAVAVERGPLVLCAESIDLPDGVDLDDVVVEVTAPPVEREGRVLVRGAAASIPGVGSAWPYADTEPARQGDGNAIEVVLRPYNQWAERGPTAMRVWLPSAR